MLYDKRWEEAKVEPEQTIPAKPEQIAAQRILLDAADLIEREGWVKKAYRSWTGYCAVGAIQTVACRTQNSSFHAVIILTRHIGDIIIWNDNIAQNKAEVVRVMREAAGAANAI